jgi:hypothetical protein
VRQRIWQLNDAPVDLRTFFFVVDREPDCAAQKVSFEQLRLLLSQFMPCCNCEGDGEMRGKPFRFGPMHLGTGVTDILSPPTLTAGVLNGGAFPSGAYAAARIVLTHIRVVNPDAGGCPISLFIGASGASASGTEFAWSVNPVLGNSYLDWNGACPLDVTDFLTGFAGVLGGLTIEGEGEIFIA